MIPYSEVQPYDEMMEGNLTSAFRQYIEAELAYIVSRVSKGMKVLEVGCGSGRVMKKLVPLVQEIVGVDHSFVQVEVADKALEQHGNARVVFCDATDIPFGDNYFHLSVSAFNTFGNLGYDKFRMLRETRRVTKPQGRIMLSVYGENAANYQRELYDKLGFENSLVGDYIVVHLPNGSINISERFSTEKLTRLFRDSGFTDENIEIVRIGEFGYMCDLKNLK